MKRSQLRALRWVLDALGLCFIWSVFAGGQLASLVPVAVISIAAVWIGWSVVAKRADGHSDR